MVINEKVKDILEWVLCILIALVLAILVRYFVGTPTVVKQYSMYPTLKDHEILLLKKYDHSFERFDIIVFNYNGSRLIKRVIGLISEEEIYCSTNLSLFPFSEMGRINK